MPKLAPRHLVSNHTLKTPSPSIKVTPASMESIFFSEKQREEPSPRSSESVSVCACLPDPVLSTIPPHVEVRALAGTGKTTTIIKGMMYARGMTVDIQPSEQQRAIFEALKAGNAQRVIFGAFGNAIAAYLKQLLDSCGLSSRGCEAKTMHSMGNYAVRKAFGQQRPEENNDQIITCRVMNAEPHVLRKEKPGLLKGVKSLVSLCKCNLTEPTEENLQILASHYGIEFTNDVERDSTFAVVPEVMNRAKEPKGTISFDDMVWLPNVLNFPMWKNELLLGDECQDWNLAQQGIAARVADRLVIVGDEYQSIFGFAGADIIAMRRQRERLGAEARGCITLPLTVTRRCSKAVVREAQAHVPEFEAHPSNPEGKVIDALFPTQQRAMGKQQLPVSETYLPLVKEGDMVLCRFTAPLVSQCLKQISMGNMAYVVGKRIGEALLGLVNKLAKDHSLIELAARLDEWSTREIDIEKAMRFPSESKIDTVKDKRECLMLFIREAQTVTDVKDKIANIFSDKSRVGIQHSTIHRAKGLEADNVFLLQPACQERRPIKLPWEIEQERNLLYVAKTRAKLTLTYVQ